MALAFEMIIFFMFQVLSSSKVLSEEITIKQEVTSMTENEIDETRNGYKPVSYFCLLLLSHKKMLGHKSMSVSLKLFQRCRKKCERRFSCRGCMTA